MSNEVTTFYETAFSISYFSNINISDREGIPSLVLNTNKLPEWKDINNFLHRERDKYWEAINDNNYLDVIDINGIFNNVKQIDKINHFIVTIRDYISDDNSVAEQFELHQKENTASIVINPIDGNIERVTITVSKKTMLIC